VRCSATNTRCSARCVTAVVAATVRRNAAMVLNCSNSCELTLLRLLQRIAATRKTPFAKTLIETVFTAQSLIAERGIAKASCPSVCPIVCNVEVS